MVNFLGDRFNLAKLEFSEISKMEGLWLIVLPTQQALSIPCLLFNQAVSTRAKTLSVSLQMHLQKRDKTEFLPYRELQLHLKNKCPGNLNMDWIIV